MAEITTDKLAAGSIAASATIYTAPGATRARLVLLRLQYMATPVGTYTINLIDPGVTVRVLTTVNPAVGTLLRLDLDDRLSPGDQLQLGMPAGATIRYWLSGTEYVD